MNNLTISKIKFVFKKELGDALLIIFLLTGLFFVFAVKDPKMVANPGLTLLGSTLAATLVEGFFIVMLASCYGGYPPKFSEGETVIYKNGYTFKEMANNKFTVMKKDDKNSIVLLQNQTSKEYLEVSYPTFNSQYGAITDLR